MTLSEQGQMPDVTEEIEVIFVDSRTAVCDGGVGVLGHPRVFLAIDATGEVECPYCSRRFVFAPDKAGTSTTMEILGRLLTGPRTELRHGQRLENWKLRRALRRPYFLRSTRRGSRRRKPPVLSAGRRPGS